MYAVWLQDKVITEAARHTAQQIPATAVLHDTTAHQVVNLSEDSNL